MVLPVTVNAVLFFTVNLVSQQDLSWERTLPSRILPFSLEREEAFLCRRLVGAPSRLRGGGGARRVALAGGAGFERERRHERAGQRLGGVAVSGVFWTDLR